MLRLVFLIVSFSSPSWFGRCSCFLCESEHFFLITGIPKVPPWCERIRGQRSLVHIPEAQLSLDCVGLNFIGLESRSPSLFSDTLGCSPKRKKKQCCYIGFLAEWEWMIRKGRFFFFKQNWGLQTVCSSLKEALVKGRHSGCWVLRMVDAQEGWVVPSSLLCSSKCVLKTFN